jgi:hypothetical protein
MTPQKKRSQGNRLPSDSRSFTIRGIRHDPPDIHKLAKVIISLVVTEIQDEEAPEHGSPTTRESIISTEEQQITHPEAA